MPLLTLTTFPARTDPGQRQAIAHELGDHTARLLHKRLPVTAVAISGAPSISGNPSRNGNEPPKAGGRIG